MMGVTHTEVVQGQPIGTQSEENHVEHQVETTTHQPTSNCSIIRTEKLKSTSRRRLQLVFADSPISRRFPSSATPPFTVCMCPQRSGRAAVS